MTQEDPQNEVFHDELEELRTTIAERHGLADLVDEVYAAAELMDIGEVLEFDARYATLRVELAMDGFKTELIPKMKPTSSSN